MEKATEKSCERYSQLLKQMNNVSNHPVVVVGVDIDPTTCFGLTCGDKVLLEVNGERLFGHGDNPLLADEPWTVERNSPPGSNKPQLVVSHPFHPHPIILNYGNMLHQRGPAVFKERDVNVLSDEQGNPIEFMVILQLVSQYLPSDEAEQIYHNNFDISFLVGDERENVKSALRLAVSRLEGGGWRYKSICRFSLRSGVSISELQSFVSGKPVLFETIVKIGQEFGWMPSFKRATNSVYTQIAAPCDVTEAPSCDFAQYNDRIEA